MARLVAFGVLVCSFATLALGVPRARAFGEAGAVDVRMLDYRGGSASPRPQAAQRLAWEVRQRTSVETRSHPTQVRLDDPALFETPFLYWSGDQAFAPMSEREVVGLRRFVDFGGFVLIDDAAPEGDGFDASVRRELARAFGRDALQKLPADHTVYRSFYLLDRPVGRVRVPDYVEAIERDGRAAVIYSRHDLGGAWDRDDMGNWRFAALANGERQRELAYRFGINVVMYALCLDYKDDQVHAPFILQRQALPQ